MLPILRWHLIGFAALIVVVVSVAVLAPGPYEVETSHAASAPGAPGTALVPMRSLVRTANGWSIYLAHHRHAWEMPVEIKQVSDSTAEIIAGLRVGAPIIVSPTEQIRNRVRIREKRKPA